MNIRNVSRFAKQQGASRQLIRHRMDQGYQFGILNGKVVTYNPATTEELTSANLEDAGKNFNYELQESITDELP